MSIEILVNEIPIPEDLIQQWQKIVDNVAEIFDVPTGLIMRVHPDTIEVFISSKTHGNPYHVGDSDKLHGLYCETVIKTQDHLLVTNALADPKWDHNPDIKLNMISYLGFPVNWPDGKNFGTICVLDSKPNPYSEKFVRLLKHFKEYLEADLALIHKNIKLEYLIRKNQEFYGILTHDLRNPLSAIIFSTNIVREYHDQLAEFGLNEIFDIIMSSSVYMKKLIDDLLNHDAVEGGYLPLSLQSVDYNEFIREIFARNQIIASIYGLHLSQQLPPQTNFIQIDSLRISQVLDNIILNALQFSPKGSIIQLLVETHKDFLRTSVIDEGPGISEDKIEVIFHPIKQDSFSKENPELKTTGLGLMIVKKIVDLHHGDIQMKNNPEKGTTVSFTLPM